MCKIIPTTREFTDTYVHWKGLLQCHSMATFECKAQSELGTGHSSLEFNSWIMQYMLLLDLLTMHMNDESVIWEGMLTHY